MKVGAAWQNQTANAAEVSLSQQSGPGAAKQLGGTGWNEPSLISGNATGQCIGYASYWLWRRYFCKARKSTSGCLTDAELGEVEKHLSGAEIQALRYGSAI